MQKKKISGEARSESLIPHQVRSQYPLPIPLYPRFWAKHCSYGILWPIFSVWNVTVINIIDFHSPSVVVMQEYQSKNAKQANGVVDFVRKHATLHPPTHPQYQCSVTIQFKFDLQLGLFSTVAQLPLQLSFGTQQLAEGFIFSFVLLCGKEPKTQSCWLKMQRHATLFVTFCLCQGLQMEVANEQHLDGSWTKPTKTLSYISTYIYTYQRQFFFLTRLALVQII